MEHYNRDNFERNNTGRDLYNRTSRNSSNTPKRKDFVVSFIASAIVGSALGLFYKNKVYKKTDELRDKEQDLRNKVLNYKEQAENTVNSVRDRVENFRNRSKDGLTSNELQAQKVAIQREVSDNNLSDQSPEAQEIQEAKLEATKDDFEQQNKPSATELTAQQNAIQQESKLADQSPETQEIQEAKAESQEQQNKPSAKELTAQQNAIQQESKLADQSPE
ncbi:smooth muscle caldesmon, partial [Staphylococcus capitis]